MNDWRPCEHCGRVGPRMLTSDEINRRVDEAIGYRFDVYEPRPSRSIKPIVVLVLFLAIAVAVRLLVRA